MTAPIMRKLENLYTNSLNVVPTTNVGMQLIEHMLNQLTPDVDDVGAVRQAYRNACDWVRGEGKQSPNWAVLAITQMLAHGA